MPNEGHTLGSKGLGHGTTRGFVHKIFISTRDNMSIRAFTLFSVGSNGFQFVTVSLTGHLRCWRSEGLAVKQSEISVESPSSTQQIRVTAVAIDGNLVAVGTKNGNVMMVDVSAKSQFPLRVDSTRPVTSICFTQDSTKVFVAVGGKIYEFNRSGGLSF